VEDVNVAIALRHIAEHYREKLMSVNEVARATSVSRRQLERTFRRHMGCTINQHIVRTRLAQVKKQLAETDHKVVAIAHQTGFTRPSHLFRAFRAHFRMSPKRQRQQAQRTQRAAAK
jgi:transcriptional regulator GlxA family with amidase domain